LTFLQFFLNENTQKLSMAHNPKSNWNPSGNYVMNNKTTFKKYNFFLSDNLGMKKKTREKSVVTDCLTRWALRRRERKRKTETAPVRRTLEATWMGEGSSAVAKMEGVEENGSSTGPSPSVSKSMSAAASASCASHGGMAEAETEWRMVGLWWRRGGRMERGGLTLWCVSVNGKRRWWWWHWECNIWYIVYGSDLIILRSAVPSFRDDNGASVVAVYATTKTKIPSRVCLAFGVKSEFPHMAISIDHAVKRFFVFPFSVKWKIKKLKLVLFRTFWNF